MPYPNEHACRLKSPGSFKPGSFKRTTRKSAGKVYSIIMGRLKGETTMTEQAYRYDKKTWTASSAGAHCKDHDGTFEAAAKTATIEEIKQIIKKARNTAIKVSFTKALQRFARGDGQGVGGPKQGDGGVDSCECSKCGAIAKHERGIPCLEQKCPKCGASMKPSTKQFENVEINDMAVFKVGTHNGTKYTDKDLDDIVSNFVKLKGRIRPKLKITHEGSQKKLAGLASYGDIVGLAGKVVNGVKHIFVKIANVPKQVANLIRDRRFPERSIEIYPKIKVDGKEYKNVLRNVSLLGHQPPAVPGLEPVKLEDDIGEYSQIAVGFEDIGEIGITGLEGGETEMPGEKDTVDVTAQFEELQANIEQLEADIKTKDEEIVKMKNESEADKLRDQKKELAEKLEVAQKQVVEFKKLEKEAKEGKEAKDELKKMKDKTRADMINGALEGWKKKRIITPADEPRVRALMESLDPEVKKHTVKDTDGKEREVESSQLEDYIKDKSSQKGKPDDFNEVTGDGDNTGGDGDESTMKDEKGNVRPVDNVDLEKKAKKYQEDHKDASFEEALFAVSPKQKQD